MKAESIAHQNPPSSTSGSASISSPSASPLVGSVELSTDAEVNKQQLEGANTISDTDALRTDDQSGSQSGDTNGEYDNGSLQDEPPYSMASDSDGDFESAVEDGNEIK